MQERLNAMRVTFARAVIALLMFVTLFSNMYIQPVFAVSIEDYLKTFGCSTSITYAMLEQIAELDNVADMQAVVAEEIFVYYESDDSGEYVKVETVKLKDKAGMKMQRIAESITSSFSEDSFNMWISSYLGDNADSGVTIGLVKDNNGFKVAKISGTNTSYKAALKSFQDNGTGVVIDNVLYDVMGSAQLDIADTIAGQYLLPGIYRVINEIATVLFGALFGFFFLQLIVDAAYIGIRPIRRFLDGSIGEGALLGKTFRDIVKNAFVSEAAMAAVGNARTADPSDPYHRDTFIESPHWMTWIFSRSFLMIGVLIVIVLYISGLLPVIISVISNGIYSILESIILSF